MTPKAELTAKLRAVFYHHAPAHPAATPDAVAKILFMIDEYVLEEIVKPLCIAVGVTFPPERDAVEALIEGFAARATDAAVHAHGQGQESAAAELRVELDATTLFSSAEMATLQELIDLLGDRWHKADDFAAAEKLVEKIRAVPKVPR